MAPRRVSVFGITYKGCGCPLKAPIATNGHAVTANVSCHCVTGDGSTGNGSARTIVFMAIDGSPSITPRFARIIE